MWQTVVYFSLLVIFLYRSFKRKNILGISLWGIYVVIGGFTVYCLSVKYLEDENVQLWRYLFLILCYVIYFSIFDVGSEYISVKKIRFEVNYIYKYFLIIFVACCLITIVCYVPHVLRLMTSGDYGSNRDLYTSGEMIYPYSNAIEHLAIVLHQYFQLLAYIVGFLLLRENKLVILAYLSIMTNILVSVLEAVYMSARGSLFLLALLLIVLYFFFFSDLPKRDRLFFIVMGIVAAIVIIPIIQEISAAKFAQTNDENEQFFKYMGQAPYLFNTVFSHLKQFAYGRLMIPQLLGLRSISLSSLGIVAGKWSTGFYTYVGILYMEWGPGGVILIGVILKYLYNGLVNKDIWEISDVFILFFYYYTLLNGVFVIGKSYIFNIVISILIFLLLKYYVEPNCINFDEKETYKVEDGL